MSNIASLIFYLIIIIVSTIFFSLYNHKNKIVRKIGISLAIIIPSIVSTLRYNVGIDYNNYYYSFNRISYLNWRDINNQNLIGLKSEPGFNFLIKFLSIFFDTQIIFGILTFITIIFFIYALLHLEQKDKISLIYFLYMCIYYGESLNNVRQFIAISLVFISFQYVFENKAYHFVLFILLASLLHITSILVIPIWFLWNHKKNIIIKKEKFLYIFLIGLAIVNNWKELLEIAIKYIKGLSRFTIYLNAQSSLNGTFYIKFFILVLMILCFNVYQKRNDKYVLYIYSFGISVLISTIGFSVSAVKRVGLFYELPSIILLANFPTLFKLKSSKKIAEYLIWIFGVAYFILYYYILGNAYIIPYQWK